ncbi:MAG: endopeptidase La [Clostridiales bacterium]|nr:endopeptidase La [Clostridiales bacterium]
MKTATKKILAIPTAKLIFPHSSGIVNFNNPEIIAALKQAGLENKEIILVPTDRGVIEEDYLGIRAEIEQLFSPFPFEIKLAYKAGRRVRIVEAVTENGVTMVDVRPVIFKKGSDAIVDQLYDKAVEVYDLFISKTARRKLPLTRENLNTDLDMIVAGLPIKNKSDFLLNIKTDERLLMFIQAINEALMVITVDDAIAAKVKESIDENQREYYIREQIKALSEEIGEDDESAEYRKKIEASKAPENIKEKLRKEADHLKRTAPASPEMALIKNYLDTVLELPWGVYTEDNDNLADAQMVLDEDHYGLQKVKERLIEALAVRKLSKEGRSPIICLVGPPGIGKTSIAQSIARAMNKKYVRVSFGGVRDEAEIRGHRKTYVGAMPGRIINGIKTAGSMNPVFLMDEIDKMASDYKGDPASALLEVLDPEQNRNFRDHFLEVPFDLSQVLFITTANTLETISRPLLDRMEVIEMSGYTDPEKVEIAKRHLIPKAIKQNGIKPEWVTIADEAIQSIITHYTRESGVRGLEKQVNAIMRKIARRFVENASAEPANITKSNLKEYLGERKYPETQLSNHDEVGVVTGLAWTSVGGDTLSIEVMLTKGKGEIILTGNLGDVMKESARIAVSYCRSISDMLNVDENFFKEHDIHIHVPEGATPKDGPSAGITIATALASAISNRKVDHSVAMTGELTLRGKVLPIGGLKEKTLAAVRAGIKKVFLPEENRKDYDELPDIVKQKLEFNFVSNVNSVINGALL